ncbi:MAG: galactose oxidase early set domain-containing protein, partial [Actinomycetota bacterium]|nr:galactose oxidase early set domain-containing protein [Actinomycetota bacterium]
MPWTSVINSGILAVHAALVPSGSQGEVVLFGGDEHWGAQQESVPGQLFKKTRIYDVASHTIVAATPPSPDSDVFCAHHAFAADGRLLIVGGTSKWPEGDIHEHRLDYLGHRRCWLYNPRGRTWVETARLNKNPTQPDVETSGGRWYPGCVTLGNGDVFTCFGHPMQGDSRHRNTLPERYNVAANAWINAPKVMGDSGPPNGMRPLFYTRVFTLPNGQLFFATPMPYDHATAANDGTYVSCRYDPASGDYVGHKIPQPPEGGYHEWYRAAVLLPLLPEEAYRPRALFCGESQSRKIDLGDPTGEWQPTVARDAPARPRIHVNAVILPTGTVCMVGGVDPANPESPVPQAEIFDPGIDWGTGTYSGTEDWSTDAGMATQTRNYHSTALLLPNGKIWTAGGNVNQSPGDPATVGVKTIELFEPSYIAVANRLQINSSPRFAPYGQPFEIGLDRPATNVERAALIRAGSSTHSTNNDQRYVGLAITARNGNTLTVTAPPNGNVAPPGYYMLWVVDSSDNPCQVARFVRLGHVGCSVFTDRSTFSEEEILSLGGGGQATINNALYVYFDGWLDGELSGDPSFALTWAATGAAVDPADLTLIPAGRLVENRPGGADVPQRITFPFHVRFANMDAFASVVDELQVRATFTLGPHTCSETIDLTKSPNPYMTDIDPAVNNPGWLSTDVRVFPTAPGTTKFGTVTQGSGGASAARTFIRAAIDRLNAAPGQFTTLDPTQEGSKLILWTDVMGIPLFNYVVAKVRYRANTTVAQRVKVFFRMFNTVGTALEYSRQGTYRHNGPGANTVPLIGRDGAGNLVSIPFFVSERVETRAGRPGAQAMTGQPLDASYEIKDITPTPGVEVTMFFGAWLDFNTTGKRFPRNVGTSDGPWDEAQCQSIQELVRGRHQCIVAEVYFEPDTTDPGETPGSSDNLSQRNVAILFSDNPGGPDSHTVLHTLDIKPSSLPKIPEGVVPEAIPVGGSLPGPPVAALAAVQRTGPDELFFRWYNLPDDSEVTLFFSDIDTAEIERLAALRLSPLAFTIVDKHTVRFRAGDAAWLPLPGGRDANIPALLSVSLPDTVTYGEEYRVSVQQIDGQSRQVIGAFEFTIPVSSAELIVDEEKRTLSVMKHIATTIPPTDRWYPIFLRYLHGLGKRFRALGGDPDTVHGNPDGSGDPYVPKPEEPDRPGRGRPCLEGWAVSLLLALALVLLGVVDSPGARAVIGAVAIVALAVVVRFWAVRCCGRLRCALLDHVLLGAAAAAAVLGILLVSDYDGDFLHEALLLAGLIAATAAVLSFVLRCRGACCDEVEPECAPAGVVRAPPVRPPPRTLRPEA